MRIASSLTPPAMTLPIIFYVLASPPEADKPATKTADKLREATPGFGISARIAELFPGNHMRAMNISFKTKTDVVREKLRLDIIGGHLKPGQRIVISDVAKDFGLSEIPVREAIRRLESEGLVQFTPHVGAVVSTIDEDEFLEIYLIRIELEALATRLAVPHMREKDRAVLNSLIRKAEIAIEQNKCETLGPLNKEFHMAIYQAGPYPYLLRMIADLWQKFELSSSVFAYVPDRAVPAWYEHQQIAEAVEKKDAELAAELVREQKNRTMKALETYLSQSHSACKKEET